MEFLFTLTTYPRNQSSSSSSSWNNWNSRVEQSKREKKMYPPWLTGLAFRCELCFIRTSLVLHVLFVRAVLVRTNCMYILVFSVSRQRGKEKKPIDHNHRRRMNWFGYLLWVRVSVGHLPPPPPTNKSFGICLQKVKSQNQYKNNRSISDLPQTQVVQNALLAFIFETKHDAKQRFQYQQ